MTAMRAKTRPFIRLHRRPPFETASGFRVTAPPVPSTSSAADSVTSRPARLEQFDRVSGGVAEPALRAARFGHGDVRPLPQAPQRPGGYGSSPSERAGGRR